MVRTHRHLSLVVLPIAVALLALGAATVRADDLNPPPWQRLGQTNLSTSQEWEFFTNNPGPFMPDGVEIPQYYGDGGSNPFQPFLTVSPNMTWGAFDGDGAWTPQDGAGAMSISCPNWIDDLERKLLHIQVTYAPPAAGGGAPAVSIDSAYDPLGIDHIGRTTPPVSTPIAGDPFNRWQRVEDWEILPNPDWENIVIHVPVQTTIDQVIVDTISIPEPGAAVPLAVGALMLARRRR